jgi:hypothetical protein
MRRPTIGLVLLVSVLAGSHPAVVSQTTTTRAADLVLTNGQVKDLRCELTLVSGRMVYQAR